MGFNQFPYNPIQGNGGIPFGNNDKHGDNQEFYEEMLKTFGRLYNLSSTGIINPFNFSLNDRAYDPTKKGSAY